MTDKKQTANKQITTKKTTGQPAKSVSVKTADKKTTAVGGDVKKVAKQAAKKNPVVNKAKAEATVASGAEAMKEGAATVKVNKAATAATAKAAASKESDMKAAAQKLSDVDKQRANNAIKSRKSITDLKSRAHEAKQRAQKKILEKSYVSDKVTDPLERLADTFDSSAKRWKKVVFPAMFAFILLATYGFFLIYRLTHDIAVLSQSVTHMAVIVSDAMPRMSNDLNKMTGSIDNMTDNVGDMSGDISGMTNEVTLMSKQMQSMTPMSNNIHAMTRSMDNMNRSVFGMQRDMSGMNRTISSGPFGMMSDVMPFSSSDNVPPPVQRNTPIWPPQNWQPHYQPNYQFAPQYGSPRAFARPQARPLLKKDDEAKSVNDKGDAEKSKPTRRVIIPDTGSVPAK